MNAVLSAQVEILPLGHGDVDEMLAVEQSVSIRFPGRGATSSTRSPPATAVWGCRVAGELVGYSVVMVAVDEAHLLNLSVAERRVRGWASGPACCATRCAGRPPGRGDGAVARGAAVERQGASTLYRHFGFQQIGVRRAYYAAAAGREDALVLRHLA
jgi:ribosomal-protein-alanine N-acetyltransferase